MNLGHLLDCFDLHCGVCGRLGSNAFRDEAGLTRMLGAFASGGIRTLTRDHLMPYGPVHKRCVTPARRRPAFGYDILESVK